MITSEDMKRAVRIYKEGPGTVQMKNKFLMEKKGFDYQDCLNALNIATGGLLVEVATQ